MSSENSLQDILVSNMSDVFCSCWNIIIYYDVWIGSIGGAHLSWSSTTAICPLKAPFSLVYSLLFPGSDVTFHQRQKGITLHHTSRVSYNILASVSHYVIVYGKIEHVEDEVEKNDVFIS